MRFISTTEAPTPAGHYSQAVVHGGTVYVSGLLAVNPDTGEKELGSVELQADRVLENLDAILRAAGTDRNHVLKVTVYISDITLWGRFNTAYARFFGDHKPSRAVVPVPELHHGFAVELECIAALREPLAR